MNAIALGVGITCFMVLVGLNLMLFCLVMRRLKAARGLQQNTFNRQFVANQRLKDVLTHLEWKEGDKK